MMAAVVGPSVRARKVARRPVSSDGGASTPRRSAARIAGSSGGRSGRVTGSCGAGRAHFLECDDHAVAKAVDESVDVARGWGERTENAHGARRTGEAGGGIERGSRVPEAVGDDAVHWTLCALENDAQPGAHEGGDLAIAGA